MPQSVICHECRHVLYNGKNLKPPDEIILKHDGKCPNCGKKLALVPIDVEISPFK